MKNSDLVRIYQKRLKEKNVEVTLEASDILVETLFETISRIMAVGEKVIITNFGTFRNSLYNAKEVSINWGEDEGKVVKSEPFMRPSFKPATSLVKKIRDRVPVSKD